MTTLAQQIRTFFQSATLNVEDLDSLESVLSDQSIVDRLASGDIALTAKITSLLSIPLSSVMLDNVVFFAQLLHNHGISFGIVKPYIAGVLAEKNHIPFVEIYTREPIDAETKQKMTESIQSQLFAKFTQCTFHFGSDPDIIGGFRVCHRDTVWDYTLEAQLTAFHQQFISL